MELKEFELISVVCTFSPTEPPRRFSVGLEDIERLEDEFGGTVNAAPFLGDVGQGVSIAIPRIQLDVLLLADRIEVRSQAASIPDVADQLVKLLNHVLNIVGGSLNWRSVGYNYVFTTRQDHSATQTIRDHLIHVDLIDRLADKQIELVGAASSLWMELDNKAVLYLRLNPHRANVESTRLNINANFSTAATEGKLPTTEEIKLRVTQFKDKLDSVLEGIGL